MIFKKLSGVDSGLNNRYQRLVTEHMNSSERLSAGLKALSDKISSFASTQAAWRFYPTNRSVWRSSKSRSRLPRITKADNPCAIKPDISICWQHQWIWAIEFNLPFKFKVIFCVYGVSAPFRGLSVLKILMLERDCLPRWFRIARSFGIRKWRAMRFLPGYSLR